ncbi:MAG TPA: aminodeoxychorismate synthase component I [Spirochaetota bacterium]|nr:aminodeoxychorismate synthase component I [Spirochaetota bacterium]HOL57914.1 aminodeoxychorismate synthase component I [Spirochaetota bacterium]HPP03844.1 aminodeoxychorismate synthase component I [Spirochaetota bacterium]
MNFIEKMNHFTNKDIPFLFVISFEKNRYEVLPLSECESKNIFYFINGKTNFNGIFSYPKNLEIKIKKAIDYNDYLQAFNKLKEHFIKGNTYLANLTFKTEIELNCNLLDIFLYSTANYKLFFKDEFVLFSPETFINVMNGYIYTYPMKGTISATLPDSDKILLNDEKEFAEHITVVDLLRNDLGIVSDEVEVTKFRYLVPVFNKIRPLYQTISEIKGRLRSFYLNNPGDLFNEILPAGSVTGAPKKKTVEIIKEIENYDRGYYTGVFGIWENKNIYSSVMIRFIEKENGKFFYKSGGGITIYSDPEKEYKEILEKIYI